MIVIFFKNDIRLGGTLKIRKLTHPNGRVNHPNGPVASELISGMTVFSVSGTLLMVMYVVPISNNNL